MAETFYNKHYIRIDENNFVVKSFSDAFEHPQSTDICINEEGGRHYNPVLFGEKGVPLFKWVDGEMIETSTEEQTVWLTAHITADQKIADLKVNLSTTDYAIIKIAEGSATVEQYAELITQRQAWRNEINQLGG